jgi:hypothetical protein
VEFNQVIIQKLDSLFAEYGLEVTEQSNSFIKYKSQKLVVTLIHNHRENLSNFWIGKDDKSQLLIDGNIIKKFFTYDLENIYIIPEKTVHDFAKNAFVFFNGEGKKMLEGDDSLFFNIKKFIDEANSEYTVHLVERHHIEAANNAWRNGNYSEVINHLGKVNESGLTASLRKKLKMARKKV